MNNEHERPYRFYECCNKLGAEIGQKFWNSVRVIFPCHGLDQLSVSVVTKLREDCANFEIRDGVKKFGHIYFHSTLKMNSQYYENTLIALHISDHATPQKCSEDVRDFHERRKETLWIKQIDFSEAQRPC